MAQCQFLNPVNGSTYTWQTGFSEEEEAGKVRTVSHTATTNDIGMVRQQGEDQPFVHRVRGHITRRAQVQQFWYWYNLCRTQTIHFRDFDNAWYEVQITSFLRKRIRKLRTLSPDASMQHHYIEYSLEMEVVRFISGDEQAAGVAV